MRLTASGAMFDPEHGGCLYVGTADRLSTVAPGKQALTGPLTTWHGERVGTYWAISSWKQYSPAGEPYTMTAIQARINGRDYYGRYGSDWSQLVRLRPCKRAAQ